MRRERGQGRVYLYDCEFVHGLPLVNRTAAGMNPPTAAWFRANAAAPPLHASRRKIGLEIGRETEAHCPHGSNLTRGPPDLRRRAMT
jgi:hypothetical protein